MFEKMDAYFASIGSTGEDLIWFWLGSMILSLLIMGGILWVGSRSSRHTRKQGKRLKKP